LAVSWLLGYLVSWLVVKKIEAKSQNKIVLSKEKKKREMQDSKDIKDSIEY